MAVEQAAVLSLLPPVSGRRVLDAGCGTGRYIQLLGALGARVIGIDQSPAMLARARECDSAIMRGDMAALPVASATCDIVVSGLCLMDVASLDPVVAECARVLRMRGIVVYSTLHPSGRDQGWTRTFESSNGTRTMTAHWHTRDDHERACGRAGLKIEAIEEPALTPAGQAVALVIRARRVA